MIIIICVVEHSFLGRLQTLAMPASPISKRYILSASTCDQVVDYANSGDEGSGQMKVTLV